MNDPEGEADRDHSDRREHERVVRLRREVATGLLEVSAAARRDAERLLAAGAEATPAATASPSDRGGWSKGLPFALFAAGLVCGLGLTLLMKPADGVFSSPASRHAGSPTTLAAPVTQPPINLDGPSRPVLGGTGGATDTSNHRPASEALVPTPPAMTSEVTAAPTEIAAPRHRLAILPFESLTQAGGETHLGTAVVDTVSRRVAELGFVEVVPASADAGWVVAGEVQQIGRAVRVTARIVDTREGTIAFAVTVDGDLDELPRVRTDVATEIHRTLVDTFTDGDSAGEQD